MFKLWKWYIISVEKGTAIHSDLSKCKFTAKFYVDYKDKYEGKKIITNG